MLAAAEVERMGSFIHIKATLLKKALRRKYYPYGLIPKCSASMTVLIPLTSCSGFHRRTFWGNTSQGAWTAEQ